MPKIARNVKRYFFENHLKQQAFGENREPFSMGFRTIAKKIGFRDIPEAILLNT
jgi:hypothetical protein